MRIKGLDPFSGACCLALEHSVSQCLGKVYRSCWRQPVLNGLQAALAVGKEICWNLSGGKGWHLREVMVGNRVSSRIQKGCLRCRVFGPGGGVAVECWSGRPFAGRRSDVCVTSIQQETTVVFN